MTFYTKHLYCIVCCRRRQSYSLTQIINLPKPIPFHMHLIIISNFCRLYYFVCQAATFAASSYRSVDFAVLSLTFIHKKQKSPKNSPLLIGSPLIICQANYFRAFFFRFSSSAFPVLVVLFRPKTLNRFTLGAAEMTYFLMQKSRSVFLYTRIIM